ncbi:MAG: outer membrane protein transport protein [Pseudomonadales bacterium]|nr:outer membrane protein transport protein [Pseudomonadales bacterium]
MDSLTYQFEESLGFLSFLTALQLGGVTPKGIGGSLNITDTVNWGIGFEYQYNTKTALRLGYEPRKAGIPKDKRSFYLPLNDIDIIAVGLSHEINKTNLFDITIATASSDEFIPTGSSPIGNNHATLRNFLLQPTAGLDTRTSARLLLVQTSYRLRF